MNPAHGTPARWMQHRRDNDMDCGPCREAWNRQQRDYADNPDTRARRAAERRTKYAATMQLIANHRSEYLRLLFEARSKDEPAD